MSQNPDQNRVAPLSGTEAKSPLDRAKQIQEMQRAAEAQPVTAPQPLTQAAPVQEAQAGVAASLHKAAEVFDVKPVEQVNLITAPKAAGADQAAYGAKQVDESALFGSKGSDIEVTGTPWKIIPFGPPQTAAVLDTKKPIESYNLHVPEKAVKHKEGLLFQITATPKAGGEPPIKKAVITDENKEIKGVELKNKGSLERAINEIPSFAMNLFRSVFGDGVKQDDPKAHHRVVSVEPGKKSAYEVKIERKNTIDGKWKTETVQLNNFGLKVPPSNDPRRHDIVVAMYYLDRFQAA